MFSANFIKVAAITGTLSAFTAVSIAIIVTVSVISTNDAVEVRADEIRSWKWECIEGRCEKLPFNGVVDNSVQDLGVCKMLCNDFGNIWPRPATFSNFVKEVTQIDHSAITIRNSVPSGPVLDLLTAAGERFLKNIKTLFPEGETLADGGVRVVISLNVVDVSVADLNLDIDESYSFTLTLGTDESIRINAQTFFGARHALETLEQLVVFDAIRKQLVLPSQVSIADRPVYPYRGISLDTSRNFYSVDSIKRTLDAMGASKLNYFHWHLTDTNSFSFYSKSHPYLTTQGAISPYKIYSEENIRDLVQYALVRGVKIVPELDAPAHVGEGWQGTDLTVCFKAEPWQNYCVQPPCGQFNPVKANLYDVLEGVYSDLFELFSPSVFHMGGDEVSNDCWLSSEEIKTWMLDQGWNLNPEDFLKLWNHFQTNARDRVYKVNGGNKLPLILWTNSLTDFNTIENYLNKDEYIIQIWETKDNPQTLGLLQKGYKIIMTNHDALYLDCGFGAWVGEGNNWCSPYIGWQKVYSNSPAEIAGAYKNLVLGGEAALWSEQADTATLDSRLWPRAGALGERLWAEPDTDWRPAERRMLQFRERLVRLGIAADALQPEWCYQNDGYCYL